MSSQKENELRIRIMSCDEEAFREFYMLHKENLFRYLKRSLDSQDAEEVLQDSFLAFIESLRNFQGNCSLKTYLFAIAGKKAVDKIRGKKIKKILFSHLPEHVVESLAYVLIKNDLDRKFLEKKIETVLEKLPNDYALILRLKYKEDYKVVEIAKRIRLSFKATESLLFRARKEFIKVYTHHERQGLFKFEKTFT